MKLADKLTPERLEALRNRSMRRNTLAQELGVTPTHLSRTLTAIGFKGEKSPEVARRKAATKRHQKALAERKAVAEKLHKGTLDLAAAASEAGCSLRTMQRHLALLKNGA